MRVHYFPDTDTMLINFNNNEIIETRDVNENILIELDKNGGLVSMTIEHATQQTNIHEFSFLQETATSPLVGATA